MAYSIGIASGLNDLLDKIRVWLVIRGWTQDAFSALGNGYRLHLHKGSTYLHLRSCIRETAGFLNNYQTGSGIAFYLGTGYDGAQAWDNQAGGPVLVDDLGVGKRGAALLIPDSPIASYQFFDDEAGNYLLMIERSPGVWRHIIWGDSLNKAGAGSWVGGAYFGSHASASYMNVTDSGSALDDCLPMLMRTGKDACSFVRADVDTYLGRWLGFKEREETSTDANWKSACLAVKSGSLCSWTTVPHYGDSLRNRLANQQDQRAILLPPMVFCHRDAGGASFLGTLPSIYATSAASIGVTIGQDITIGAGVYRLFNGFAVRKVG